MNSIHTHTKKLSADIEKKGSSLYFLLSSTSKSLNLISSPCFLYAPSLSVLLASPVISPTLSPYCSFLARSLLSVVRVRFGSRGREQRAVWNPLACWGISVSLWEPYWLPSFIIIPPPLAPSVSGTDHAFSFSPVLLAFIPSSPCLFLFCFFRAIFIHLFVASRLLF